MDDRIANIAKYVMFAFFGFIVVLMVAATYTPGFNAMCERGRPKVFDRLARVESYIVQSPSECASFCLDELRRGDVAFLEYEVTDEMLTRRRRFPADETWEPKKPGKYAFRIRSDSATCAGLLRQPTLSAAPNEIHACIVVELLEDFRSRVEFKRTYADPEYRQGRLLTTTSAFHERATGKVLAREVDYFYHGQFALLPIRIEQRCPHHGFLGIADVKK